MCAPHVYLVLGAIRRAHVILWAESQETALNCLWVLWLESWFCGRACDVFPAEPSLSSPELPFFRLGAAQEKQRSLLSLCTTVISRSLICLIFDTVTSSLKNLQYILTRLDILLTTLKFWFLISLTSISEYGLLLVSPLYILRKVNAYAISVCGFFFMKWN